MNRGSLLNKISNGFQVGCRFSFLNKDKVCWSSVGLQKWEGKYKVYINEILESMMSSEEYLREELIEFNTIDDALKFIERNTNAKINDLAPCKGQEYLTPHKVTVRSRTDAEQLFLDRYLGDGYKNMTGESGPSTKNLMDFLTNKNTKAGTYHWDDIMDPNNPGRVSGHGTGNPDGELPHLQVHQNDGKIIHIFFP